MKKPKRPRDPNQLSKSIVDLATGEKQDNTPLNAFSAYATEFARMGGLKGGKARAKKLSPKRRREIAKKAAKARWNKVR
jgi:hypothetical protein